ncbi:MAG: EamA family transporter [Candidatus Neomarinimicrobiota bacterium]|nr:EamA family transporter [Candidatus Neomarinimicrobiota bacterium]
MNNRILFPFIALCLIWGSTWYFIKISLNAGMPPFFGVGFRFFLSGLLFFLIIAFQKKSIPLNKQAMKLYLSFGLLNFALSYGITYWATQYIYSSISSILWGLFPLFTSVMAHFMLSGDDKNEKLTTNKLLALFLGFIGMVFIGSNQSIDLQSQSFFAILVLVGAIIIAAWPSVLYKKHNDVVGPYQMNAVCQTLTGVIMLSLSYLLKEDLTVMIWDNQLIFASVYLVIFGGVISWGIYFWLYQHLSVTQVTYVAIFPPIVAIILGWIFLNEVLSTKEIIGTAFILGSSVLIYRK